MILRIPMQYTRFFYKQHFYKQRQADIGKWDWKWNKDHIDTTYIDLDLDMDINILNMKCVSVKWSLYVLSNTSKISSWTYIFKDIFPWVNKRGSGG